MGKPLWLEGMFLRPQHLQQYDRWIEGNLDHRVAGLTPYPWGVRHIEFDKEALKIGQIRLNAADVVFPDGTLFICPGPQPLPHAVHVAPASQGKKVFLALPIRAPGASEVSDGLGMAQRFRNTMMRVTDNAQAGKPPAEISIGTLNVRIAIEGERLDELTYLPIGEIEAVGALGQVTLTESYIPPVMSIGASLRLVSILEQIRGLLRSRAASLAAGASGQSHDTRSGMLDVMLLGIANRAETVMAHLISTGLHSAERAYCEVIALAAEISAYASPTRRVPDMPAYNHLDLRTSFEGVLAILREMLSVIVENNTLSIPLTERDFGIWLGEIKDRMALASRRFVLIARADMALESIRQQLPLHIKIGPVEQIRDLVNLQLPGIAIQPLSVAPREIPFIQNAVYFEVDTSNALWVKMRDSAAFALHVSGSYPALGLELWAIQREAGR